jgi:hypothetical protein
MRYDEMVYHLTAPLYYLQVGGVIPYPEGGNIVWPHYAEMLFTLGIQTAGLNMPRLLHLSMGVLSTLLVFIIARRLLNPRAGVIAAVLFAATPFIGYEMGTAYIDLFVTAYTTAMAFALVLWVQQNQERWLLVAGILGGIGVGIKLTAGPMVAGLVMFIVLIMLVKRRFTRTLKWLAAMVGVVIILALPWLVRDAIWTGDPFYPYGSMFLEKIGVSAPAGELAASPTAQSEFLRYLRYPVEMVFNSTRYYHESPGGMSGALTLLAIPLFLLNRKLPANIKWIIAGLLLASAVALAVMIIVNSMLARYATAIFPWLALSAAANGDYLLGWVYSFNKRRAMLGVLLFWGLAYVVSTRLPLIVRQYENLPQRFPINFVLGRESREDYLSRNFVLYDAFQFIDSQPGDRKRILSIGNEFRLYTQAFIGSVYDVADSRRMVANAKDPADLADRMAEAGFDFILINHPEVDFRLWKYHTPFPILWGTDFLNRYSELLFAQNGVYVYRFHPEGTDLLAPQNLLQNSGFEEIEPANTVADWQLDGTVIISNEALVGNQSFYVGAPLSPEGFGYALQRVPVSVGEIYTLGYWLRADQPAVFLMRVNWLDEFENLIGFEERWKNVGQNWEWHSLFATAPLNAQYAEVVVSYGGTINGYVDEVCLAQGQRCP